MASPQEMRELSVRFVQAVNSRDPDAVASNYTEDATYTDPALPEPLRGRKAIARLYAELFQAFPDSTFELVSDVVEGHRQAIEWVLRGTSRPRGGVHASGRIELKGLSLQDYVGGKIAREVAYYDVASLVEKSGVLGFDRY